MSAYAQMLGLSVPPSEMDRICALPRTAFQADNVPPDIIAYWSGVTRRPGSDATLRPAQALALHTMYHERALLAPIAVGGGKSLVALLAHHAFPDVAPSDIMLVLPASNRHSLNLEFEKHRDNLYLNSDIHVVSYANISHPDNGPTLLREKAPRVLVFDEGHKLSNPEEQSEPSARTLRVMKYADENADCRFVIMSGTLFNRSVKNVTHLAELALRERTPFPRSWSGLNTWSLCCDVQKGGELAQPWQWQQMQQLVDTFHPAAAQLPRLMTVRTDRRREICREALYERLRTCPGIVQSPRTELGVSLYWQALTPRPPEKMTQMLEEVARTYVLPTGEELDSPLELHRAQQQISMGCYYRWDWPGEPDIPWLRARNAFNRATRQCIAKFRHMGVDSPAIAERFYLVGMGVLEEDTLFRREQAEPAVTRHAEWLEYAAAHFAWSEQRHKPEPPTVAVWFTDWFVEHALAHVEGDSEALLWTAHSEVAARFTELLPPGSVVGAGAMPPTKRRKGPVVLSLRSHGTGHNLQEWGRSVLTCPTSSPDTMQQWAGRIHRSGQQRDEVFLEVYAHTAPLAKSLTDAKKYALLGDKAGGEPQKILHGTWLAPDSS